jgi:hypothetical protein
MQLRERSGSLVLLEKSRADGCMLGGSLVGMGKPFAACLIIADSFGAGWESDSSGMICPQQEPLCIITNVVASMWLVSRRIELNCYTKLNPSVNAIIFQASAGISTMGEQTIFIMNPRKSTKGNQIIICFKIWHAEDTRPFFFTWDGDAACSRCRDLNSVLNFCALNEQRVI